MPAGVDADVVTVSVEDAEGVRDSGLNDPALPAGRPLTLNLTGAVVPLRRLAATEYVVFALPLIFRDDGLAAREKSKAAVEAVTVTVRAVVDVAP